MNKIYKEYHLPLQLYIRLKKSIQFENQKDMNELTNFIEELPHKLKIETSLYIYEDRYNKVKFLKGRSPSFITWLCPLLKP